METSSPSHVPFPLEHFLLLIIVCVVSLRNKFVLFYSSNVQRSANLPQSISNVPMIPSVAPPVHPANSSSEVQPCFWQARGCVHLSYSGLPSNFAKSFKSKNSFWQLWAVIKKLLEPSSPPNLPPAWAWEERRRVQLSHSQDHNHHEQLFCLTPDFAWAQRLWYVSIHWDIGHTFWWSQLILSSVLGRVA